MGRFVKQAPPADFFGGQIDDVVVSPTTPTTGDFTTLDLTGELMMGNNKITGLLAGVAATDAATVSQIASASAGLFPKAPCDVATDADLDTIGNGTWVQAGAGVGATLTAGTSGTTTIDSVVLSDGDRVLVKDQGAGDENGIYIATATGGGSNTILTRATDFDGSPSNDVVAGSFTFVLGGTTQDFTGWILLDTGLTGGAGPPQEAVVDTDPLSFVQFQGLPDGATGAFTEDAQLNLYGGTSAGAALTAGAATNFLAGNQAGSRLSTGDDNVFIGTAAGRQNVTANLNIAIGASAMGDNSATPTGTDNIAIGQSSMDTAAITTATGNIAIGVSTLNGITTGDDNVAIGSNAGDNISTGDNNVMIGPAAGPTTNQTDRLYINNASSDTPLIGGDFATGLVELSGAIRFTERADHIGTPAATFGELWVRNDGPNVLVFTDDAGTDTVLSSGGDVTKVGTPVNNQIGVWTGDGTIEGDANLTWDGATQTVTTTTAVKGIAIVHSGNEDGLQVTKSGEFSGIAVDMDGTTEDAGIDVTVATGGTGVGISIIQSSGTTNHGLNVQLLGTASGAAAVLVGGRVEINRDLKIAEQSDHSETPAAGFGQVWVRDDEPNKLIFTDDAGTDFDLTDTGSSGGFTAVVETTTTRTAADGEAVLVDDDTAAGTVTITLPPASLSANIMVKKLGTTADVIIDGDGSETIDGATTFTLTTQYDSITMISDGSNWFIY